MKKLNKIILTALFSIVYVVVSAQIFKKFEPMAKPFKIFESPIIKFDSTRNIPNKNNFSANESQIFTRNNGMPILQVPESQANMPIYKPDINIKQSLIIDNPKDFELPAKK